MARLLKVWFILWGVLALTGCAGMGGQPVKTVQPEKVVLDWKDFYPSDFLPGCNQRVNLDTAQKRIFIDGQRLCYLTDPLFLPDRYSLILDVFSFDDEQQTFIDRIYSEDIDIAKYGQSYIYGCPTTPKQISNNAVFCSDSTPKILLAINSFVRKGKVVEARLQVSLNDIDEVNESSSEYKTAMRILSDKNLLSLVD